MQKIRKILRAVSEKTALPTNQPTNQPTNYYQNTDLAGPRWRRSNKCFFKKSNILFSANIYLFKVNNRNIRKTVKYVQS